MAVLMATGYQPYLGGPATWAPLRACAPDLSFESVDLLDISYAGGDLRRTIVDAIGPRIAASDAVIAHGTIAGAIIEAAAKHAPHVPVVLLAPLYRSKDSSRLRIARAVVRSFSRPLNAFALKKLSRLVVDERYLRKQMKYVVANDLISDELLSEAAVTAADPRLRPYVAHTAEVLLSAITPVDAELEKNVQTKTTLPGRGAAMLERPQDVIDALRRALADYQSLKAMSS